MLLEAIPSRRLMKLDNKSPNMAAKPIVTPINHAPFNNNTAPTPVASIAAPIPRQVLE